MPVKHLSEVSNTSAPTAGRKSRRSGDALRPAGRRSRAPSSAVRVKDSGRRQVFQTLQREFDSLHPLQRVRGPMVATRLLNGAVQVRFLSGALIPG